MSHATLVGFNFVSEPNIIYLHCWGFSTFKKLYQLDINILIDSSRRTGYTICLNDFMKTCFCQRTYQFLFVCWPAGNMRFLRWDFLRTLQAFSTLTMLVGVPVLIAMAKVITVRQYFDWLHLQTFPRASPACIYYVLHVAFSGWNIILAYPKKSFNFSEIFTTFPIMLFWQQPQKTRINMLFSVRDGRWMCKYSSIGK